MLYKSKDKKGVTLVELLVTSVIGVIIAGAVFSFVTFSGKATDEMTALQVLRQESSMISEVFMRKVRLGTGVCEVDGDGCVVPGDNTEEASHIRVYSQGGTNIEFRISGGNTILEMKEGVGSFRNISGRLGNSGSKFIIQPFGYGVQLQIILESKVYNKSYIYTETIGSVRCKNPAL